MIRQSDENPGKLARLTAPRALLRSMERHLRAAGPVSEDAIYQAQQLVYDAWDATTDKRETELILQALELNPLNLDALLHILRHSGVEGEEEIACLRHIVAAGAQALGPKVFKNCAGGFWGFIETRPYMRARHELAEALRADGRYEEAIAEYEAMLELNPADNQGVRYSLLCCYLVTDCLEGVRRLARKYKENRFNVVFAWGHVLERFLAGELVAATRALKPARLQNAHMEAFLTGRRKLPRRLPEAYAPGSKDEAVAFAEGMMAAWRHHPKALRWLASQS